MPSITITFGEMTPVDKYEETEDGLSCPLATKDSDLNNKNREEAIEVADYRDPSESGAFRLSDVCGNCAAYNQTEEILDCIGDDSGQVGYCQLLKFFCSQSKQVLFKKKLFLYADKTAKKSSSLRIPSNDSRDPSENRVVSSAYCESLYSSPSIIILSLSTYFTW